jgi:hypothetical protein
MATNTATANVKGGLFGDSAGLSQLVSISGKDGRRSSAAKNLAQKSMLALRKIMITTAGVAPGAVATQTFPQVEANVELGGKRAITQTVLINRATTAADVSEYKNDVLAWSTRTTFGSNPVPNKDGNPLGTR